MLHTYILRFCDLQVGSTCNWCIALSLLQTLLEGSCMAIDQRLAEGWFYLRC